jgi:hypothetical protein
MDDMNGWWLVADLGIDHALVLTYNRSYKTWNIYTGWNQRGSNILPVGSFVKLKMLEEYAQL